MNSRGRPFTTKEAFSSAAKTINEEFNEKLIQHGTEKGVPTSELPAGRASAAKLTQGTAAASESVRAHMKGLTRPPSNYMSNSYKIKPRESIAGRKRLASAKIKQEINQYL